MRERLKDHLPAEALQAQFRQPRFRENNSTPLLSSVFPFRIIVALNCAGQQTTLLRITSAMGSVDLNDSQLIPENHSWAILAQAYRMI
jgi:hypothetical protein